MSEVDQDESKACWRDVIILLRGDLRAGLTASQVLADVLEEDELPTVFHELCTRYLVAKEWTSRTNAGVTIKNLCVRFASRLTPLIAYSKSDGELLTLSELDVFAVSCCKDAELLSGDSNSTKSVEGRDIYSKSWLRKQRKALRKRLGLESLTEDAAIATDYISDELFVDDSDLTGGNTIVLSVDAATVIESEGASDREELYSSAAAAATITCDKSSQEMNHTEQSTETWFARYAGYSNITAVVTHSHIHIPL